MAIERGRLLVALRLARPVRWRGFCPACALGPTADPRAPRGVAPATDGIVVALVLGVAALAWGVLIWQMLGSGMAMGLGSAASFATLWMVMMTAMMLPSATPLVYRFARLAEGRRRCAVAVAVLGLAYLAVWLAFGVVCYLAYDALGMPWRNQALAGGVALGLAAGYALTPIQRISRERCRDLSALRGPLPFGLVRAGAVAGWRYGLTCIGCSAGLMMAMVLVGMMSLGWTVALGALVLVYKLGPPATRRLDIGLALVVVALAIVYAMMA